MLPFNKPYFVGTETRYIEEAVRSGKISGDGMFTRRCEAWFVQHLGVARTLLTTSCTDALELAALLLDIQPGDEVLLPSFTFSSTANAFALRGARLVFVDCAPDSPGLLPQLLSSAAALQSPMAISSVLRSPPRRCFTRPRLRPIHSPRFASSPSSPGLAPRARPLSRLA